MALTLACRDIGADCPHVTCGETEEEMMADVRRHGKEVHGFNDERLSDPELVRKAKAAVKRE